MTENNTGDIMSADWVPVSDFPDEWTPQTLAAYIAEIIRGDARWWNQGTWFGDAITINRSGGGYRKDADRIAPEVVREQLKRGEWTCGTTGCVAGWAAILTAPKGSVIDPVSDRIINLNILGDRGQYADTLGREALALSDGQADYLFDGDRSKGEVLTVLDAIAAGESWNFD